MSDIDTSRPAVERLRLRLRTADAFLRGIAKVPPSDNAFEGADELVRTLLDERDALVEDAQGQDDRIVQLIQRVEAAEQERGALALSNHFYEGTTTAQRERAEAAEKLLGEAVELLRSDVPKFLQPIADFLTRYNASRATEEPSATTDLRCTECGASVQRVPENGWLNEDQWDSVKLGEYFCENGHDILHFIQRDGVLVLKARKRMRVGTEKEEGR